MNISQYIPAKTRKPIYGAFAVIGVVIGAIQVGYAAVDIANPQWLIVTLAVFPFVAGAVGFTAQAATDTTETPAHTDPTDIPEVIEYEPDEVQGVDDPTPDEEISEEELDHTPDDDALTDAVDEESGYDWSQDALEAALAADIDETPPPAGYEPRH